MKSACVGHISIARSTCTRMWSAGSESTICTVPCLGYLEHVRCLQLAHGVPLAQISVDFDSVAAHISSYPYPLAVAHLRRAFQLDHHLRVVVAVGVSRLGHLELIGAQQNREDGLDLHGGERRPHAAVAT